MNNMTQIHTIMSYRIFQ